DHDTVILLDLTHACCVGQDDLLGWRGDRRVVWLVRQVGTDPDLQGVEIQAQPLLYRELVAAAAIACGRMSRTLLQHPPPAQVVRRTSAPNVEEAVRRDQLVLVAEDNETNRDVMHEQLRLLGYAAELAADGAQALAMWQSGRYALLLTDCHMPNLDGYDLTAQIRQAEAKGPRKPIIAVTANAMYGEAERCFAFGMDDYLSKPVRMDELARVLAKWLPLSDMAAPGDRRLRVGPPPAAATAAASTVIWDNTTLAAAVGNNPTLLKRLLAKFLANATQQVQDAQDARASGDLDTLTRIAHTLKSAARAVGALALGELCQSLEAAARAVDHMACDAMCEELPTALGRADGRIQAYLDT
ncbi:MAG: response regulator, partial [Rhodoferax sp.]|nr:response regulator [Rhodoferax sp.]